jgi:hypothetical protein
MLLLLLTPTGCDSGFDSGASEAFQVRDGTYHTGEIPIDPEATTPSVIYVGAAGHIVTQGTGNIGYDGLATKDAFSVAAAVPESGPGYWTVPVDGPDVTQDGNLLFDLTADFGRGVPYGLQSLVFSAIDGDGHPGPATESSLCVLPDYAEGSFTACDPTIPPQALVLSLLWDTDVDLDLVVVTPEGKVVSPKAPTTVLPDPNGSIPSDALSDPTTGKLSRDSNRDCVIDSFRMESLVFEVAPPSGEYVVYASLNKACGEPQVGFDLRLYESQADGETWTVDETDLAAGQLLAAQADGGESLGSFVARVRLP